jgi:hypothetical protein
MKLKIDFKAFKFSLVSRESLNEEKIDSESLIFTFGFEIYFTLTFKKFKELIS